MVCAVPASANDLAVRYLLELSSDIRGALLLDRDGSLLACAGDLPRQDLEAVARRLAEAAHGISQNGSSGTRAAVPVEVDVLATAGAMFILGEEDRVMACVTNRNVHPGLIFYDMHAVLRDLERAAAAELVREQRTTS
jgi:hypothetical protein